MKQRQFLTLSLSVGILVTACSSPVDKFIKDEFAHRVRVDNLVTEVQGVSDHYKQSLKEIAYEKNPQISEYEALDAQGKKMEKDIMSRLNAYKRTGDYSYIINIYPDGEKCEAIQDKARRLGNKVRPFLKHVEKQSKAFSGALSSVKAVELIDNDTAVEIDENYVYDCLVGMLDSLKTPADEEIDTLALKVLSNYFNTHRTPSVTASKRQKNEDRWYVSLSDNTHYYVRAIKRDDGEYEYEYVQTSDSFGTEGMPFQKP